MKWAYTYHPDINLLVEGRIQPDDAARQQRTAIALLERLANQPGQILADEVGMGKTFVALGVAISVALEDDQQRPVVIMVPPGLIEKWPKDLSLFLEKCLPESTAARIRYGVVKSNVEFLKLLDDPLETRKNIIFLTHTAPNRSLKDNWLKVVMIQRALFRRHDVDHLYKRLYRFCGTMFRFKRLERDDEALFEKILNNSSSKWREILIDSGVWEEINDDPVPAQIAKILYDLPAQEFDVLLKILREELPARDSSYLNDRLRDARNDMDVEFRRLWTKCLTLLEHSIPLLILDEAHHLKNDDTKLALMFQRSERNGDVSDGQLFNVFDRMLFLTATPFQLGHQELCNVLDRFNGIKWAHAGIDGMDADVYKAAIDALRKKLDETQEAAIRFDNAWGRLSVADVISEGEEGLDLELAITKALMEPTADQSAILQMVRTRYEELRVRMKSAETELRRYLVRHLRKKTLTYNGGQIPRRVIYPGKGILDGKPEEKNGLPVTDKSLLPFLLAARLSSLNPDKRPVFSEGLASSYEAFLYTRKKAWKEDALDDDDVVVVRPETDARAEGYLSAIEEIVRDAKDRADHPKVGATIRKAVDLWAKGEKVLIFCHYVVTGRTLWTAISRAMGEWIQGRASEKLGCTPEEVNARLDKIGDRFDEGSRLRRLFEERLDELIGKYGQLTRHTETLKAIVVRYFRTPSFLLRFFPLGEELLDEEFTERTFRQEDLSGLSFQRLLENFLLFLAERCGEEERLMYFKALGSIQSGEIRTGSRGAGADGKSASTSENVLPNVRLVNGSTDTETRQNLMLTFNTPFYPDVLIATSVMSEGVDLHMNCRYVIHHDLCWNPSTLEQRTGRVDRIGAKVELCHQSIQIFHPYVAETQDEKMYKVVMDRERWFNILMGEKYTEDLGNTEKLAERLPLPADLVKDLIFKLEVE